MVDAFREVWNNKWVHLMHVSACPQDPHTEDTEEGEPVSHQAIVRGKSAVLCPNVHILSEQDSAYNKHTEKDKCAIPQCVFLDSHFFLLFSY